MTVLRSANEVESQALKAARGAGWPLSQSALMARALTVACVSQPGEAVAAYLEWLEEPIAPMQAEQVRGFQLSGHPALVLPAALDLVKSGLGPVDIPLMDLALAKAASAQVPGTYLVQEAEQLIVTASPEVIPAPDPEGPIEILDWHWEELGRWAAKTYVPASAASRLKGAGAGLTDND